MSRTPQTPPRRVNVLTISGHYPSRARPGFGTFVEERLQHVRATGLVDARVIAPLPWVPLFGSRLDGYRDGLRTPRTEQRSGVQVHYPRYLHLPGPGMYLQPFAMAASIRASLGEVFRDGWQPDIVDGHYLYPDGVAAAHVARALGLPYVLTARGSDVNVLCRIRWPRRLVLRSIAGAARVITVSGALAAELERLGVEPRRVVTLPNGVDLAAFRPTDAAARPRPSSSGAFELLSVGNLVESKGHDIVIRALEGIPDARLTVAGDGPLRRELRQLAADRGLSGRIRFAGRLDRSDLIECYQRADVLVLATEREGMPNVVLEAMACGLPVVATRVGGIPEVVDVPACGRLVEERTPEAIAAAVASVRAAGPSRDAVRRHAMQFDWGQTAIAVARLLATHARSSAALTRGAPPAEVNDRA